MQSEILSEFPARSIVESQQMEEIHISGIQESYRICVFSSPESAIMQIPEVHKRIYWASVAEHWSSRVAIKQRHSRAKADRRQNAYVII